MMTKPRQSIQRLAILSMIIGGSVLALSGLCTGFFVASGPDEYVPNVWGVIAIGLFGIVPSAILFFASRSIFAKGPRIVPGLLVLLVSVPVTALLLFSTVSLVANALRQSYNPFPIGFVVFYGVLIVLAIAVTVFGVKTIRAARAEPPEPDVF